MVEAGVEASNLPWWPRREPADQGQNSLVIEPETLTSGEGYSGSTRPFSDSFTTSSQGLIYSLTQTLQGSPLHGCGSQDSGAPRNVFQERQLGGEGTYANFLGLLSQIITNLA